MFFWASSFIAALLTIISKWYVSNAVFRLRQTLSRQQREALELKGVLQDARDTLVDITKQLRNRELDLTRQKKRVFNLTTDLHQKQKSVTPEKK